MDLPAWTAITPNSNWSASDGLAYVKDHLGFVHLKGRVTSTAGGTANPFTLPAGYRPAVARILPCVGYWHSESPPMHPCFFYVSAAGVISSPHGTPIQAGEYIIFDGVSFLAEQ